MFFFTLLVSSIVKMNMIKKFHGAVGRGDALAASALLCKDGDLLDSVYKGHTAISRGVMYNRLGVVKYLIHCGASLDTPNGDGDIPLLVAFRTEKFVDNEIIDMLVRHTPYRKHDLLVSYLRKKGIGDDVTVAMGIMIRGGEDIWSIDLQEPGWLRCPPGVRSMLQSHRRWHISHVVRQIVEAPCDEEHTKVRDDDPLSSLAANTKMMKSLPDEIWGEVMGYLG